MTTKEIAEAVGKDERTVQRWAKKASDKMSSVSDKMSSGSPANPADYDLNETCSIIEIGMGKNAADLYRTSAKIPGDSGYVTKRDLAVFGAAIVSEMIKQFLPAIQGVKPAAAQIEAPKLETRDELRRIVAKAGKASGDYSGAWNTLYQDVYYRMHRNVNECAKNRGMDKLDYIESEGILPEVIAIAREIFE